MEDRGIASSRTPRNDGITLGKQFSGTILQRTKYFLELRRRSVGDRLFLGNYLELLIEIRILFPWWQRTDGALIRLITPVGENEGVQDAEKRLKGFTGLVVPILKEYIPE